jgi:hypothetical protein
MSLINEALKKAQKQRTGENPSLSGLPGVGGEPAARIARRAKPVGFNSLLIQIGIGAGAVAVLVVAGIFLARMLTSQPAVPASAKPAIVATAETVAKPAEVAAEKPATAKGASSFVLPVAAAPAPAPLTPAPAVVESKPAVSAPAVAPPPAAPPKPAPAAKLEPKAISYIENLRIAGIRASGSDSKVLMNDRVYRIGDTVEHELGLKLTGITSNSLSFEDERGAKYTRNF